MTLEEFWHISSEDRKIIREGIDAIQNMFENK